MARPSVFIAWTDCIPTTVRIKISTVFTTVQTDQTSNAMHWKAHCTTVSQYVAVHYSEQYGERLLATWIFNSVAYPLQQLVISRCIRQRSKAMNFNHGGAQNGACEQTVDQFNWKWSQTNCAAVATHEYFMITKPNNRNRTSAKPGVERRYRHAFIEITGSRRFRLAR